MEGPRFEDSVDGVTLVQRYIEAPEPSITRLEFVGGRFLYAVRVGTSLGFALCPADDCQPDDALCPAGDVRPVRPRFRILKAFEHPIVPRYAAFLRATGIGIAGIEFIADRTGELFTYEVDTNTNYNSEVEAEAGRYGMRAIAAYLGEELQALARGGEAAAAAGTPAAATRG